jgi:apolipoprotein N-acyltransferase
MGTAATKSATWRQCLGLGSLSAALLWLSYFPANLGFLAWIALVPLLKLVRIETTPRIRYGSVYLTGLLFYLAALSWMSVPNPMMAVAYVGLSFYCSWFPPLAIYLLRRLDHRLHWPLTVTVPLVWIPLELMRSRFLGGFPWYLLGHTQHEIIPLIQVVDLGGVAWLSGLVAAVNGLIAEKLTRPQRTMNWQFATVALLLLGSFGYGMVRLHHAPFAEGPRVTLVQGNLLQNVLNETLNDGNDAVSFIVKHYVDLMDLAVATNADLYVWPESSFPPGYDVPGPGWHEAQLGQWRETVEMTLKYIAQAGRRWRSHIIFGTNARDIGPDGPLRKFNTAVYVAPTGIVMGRYDKMHRVPFGEFVPLQSYFPWLVHLNPYEGRDYSIAAGEEQTRFPLTVGNKTYRFGVLICYEDSDAPLASGLVNGPDKVDFMVNLTNDGWFKGSQEHEQHLAISRFRAVECRRSLVRAVNMGISAFIDPDGRVIHLPQSTWSASKGTTGLVTGKVPLDDRVSLFATIGDWVSWTMAALLLFLVGITVVRPVAN